MSPRHFIRRDGKWVQVSEAEFAAGQPAPRRGLGDLVAAVATPIARALHLSCIDPATKQLRPESGCAKRKAALNRLNQ